MLVSLFILLSFLQSPAAPVTVIFETELGAITMEIRPGGRLRRPANERSGCKQESWERMQSFLVCNRSSRSLRPAKPGYQARSQLPSRAVRVFYMALHGPPR